MIHTGGYGPRIRCKQGWIDARHGQPQDNMTHNHIHGQSFNAMPLQRIVQSWIKIQKVYPYSQQHNGSQYPAKCDESVVLLVGTHLLGCWQQKTYSCEKATKTPISQPGIRLCHKFYVSSKLPQLTYCFSKCAPECDASSRPVLPLNPQFQDQGGCGSSHRD